MCLNQQLADSFHLSLSCVSECFRPLNVAAGLFCLSLKVHLTSAGPAE